MVIRKLYRIESAHIVRNAISERCSHSYHGHSGVIEVFFKSSHLDKAGMVYDFGAMKDTIGKFIDMFDHSIHLWRDDDPGSIQFFKEHNSRYVILPCNPTAENYSILFRDCINEILKQSIFTNDEGYVYCSGVRYHETATGYAESDETDTTQYHLCDLIFSHGTLKDTSKRMRSLLGETLSC